MLLLLIIGCEIGFWIFLFAGLLTRYYFQQEKLSRFLLLCVPLLDLILLIATFTDLNNGATAEFAHGLAAAYLGFTLVFGKSVIAWADKKVGDQFNPEQIEDEPELIGFAYTKYEWLSWFKCILACGIAALILYVGINFVGVPERVEALSDWYYNLINLMFLWWIFGPAWYTAFPKKAKATA